MRARETLQVALEAVRLNRMRSILTVLGIMIGIASVTLTVGLGLGAHDQVKQQINALGSHLLIVSPGSSTAGGIRGGFGSATTLTRADAVTLAADEVAPDVAAVAPVASTSQSLAAGTTTWTASVVAVTPEWQAVRSRTLASGRFITEADIAHQSKVIVLGATTAEELFSGTSPVGSTVTIAGADFTVVGVLESTGSTSATSSEDDTVLMPWTTAATTVGTSATTVTTIYLQAADDASLSAAYQQANAALLTRHGLTASDDADFTITTQESIVEAATATDRTLTILLGGIAAISLVVGGIGVMNIMLVSVSERIREIGLRKAVGARRMAILTQFLIEAMVLCFLGGLLGIGLGQLLTSAIANIPKAELDMAYVPWQAVALAFVFSGTVGVFFGMFPAIKAARLDPIEALRHE